MARKLINLFLKLKLPLFASIIANMICNSKGGGIKLKHQNDLWLHKTDLFDLLDFAPKFSMSNKQLNWVMNEVYFKHYIPKPGDVCLDIGAGIGPESLYLSKRIGDTGIIHSVEASEKTYKVLKQNIELNSCKNVVCHQLAISNKNETVFIDNDEDGHIMNRVGNERNKTTVAVKGVTMDQFVKDNNITQIDYLKVNIEGAEQLLIEAFSSINKVKSVAISCHDFLGKRENNKWLFTKEKIHKFLEENNFEIISHNTGKDYADDWLYGVNKLNVK